MPRLEEDQAADEHEIIGCSVPRLTHDINDQNYSIVIGSDLLLRYWEDLSMRLREAEREPEERYQEILETIPVVIGGIRQAARQIDELIQQLTQQRKCCPVYTGKNKG